MSRTVFLLLLLPLLTYPVLHAQDCADAGPDSTICGFDLDLVGNPPGGYWTHLCDPGGQLVKIDSMFPGGIRIRVTGCGSYHFIYHIDQAPCISEDTVEIRFENRNFRIQQTQYEISLGYPNNPCHTDPKDSCGPVRVLNGFLPVTPLWRFSIRGDCESYEITQSLGGVDSANCSVDSITQDIMVTRDTARLNWTTSQPAFIDLDENGNLIKNDINRFVGFLTGALLDELNQKCPLQKCFNEPSSCLDSILIDTVQKLIPVHLGGSWYYLNGTQSQRLSDLSLIDINGEEFILYLPNGNVHYGPEPIIFELFSTDGNQNPIPLNSVQRIHLQWREEWKYDTIEYYIYREISDVNCPCQGTTILGGDIDFPPIPNFFCPDVRLIFAPEVDATIMGDSSYCKGDFAELTARSGFRTYQWSDGTTDTITYVTSPGTVILQVEDQRGCYGSDTMEVLELPQPSLSVDINKPILCRGECTQVTLGSEPGNILVWDNRDTTTMLQLCPNVTTTYRARAINEGGCSRDTLIRVQVFSAPDPLIGNTDQLTCSQTSVTLRVSRPDTSARRGYFWAGPGIDFVNKTELNPVVSEPGIYIFTVLDSISGCTGSDTVVVVIDTLKPRAFAGADLLINCLDSTVILSSDSSDRAPGFSLEWSGPGIQSSNKFDPSPEVALPGLYILKIQNLGNDCLSFDTVQVRLDTTKALADAGPDRTLPCDSASISLGGNQSTSSNLFNGQWTGSGIDSTNREGFSTKVSLPGTYVLRVWHQISGCEAADTVLVSEPDSLPMVRLIKNWDISCLHDTAVLDGSQSAGRNLKYFWAGPGIGAGDRNLEKIVVRNAGKYYLLIRDTVLNCESLDSIIVKNEAGLPLANAGPDRAITCDFVSVFLDGNTDLADSISQIIWTGPGINGNNGTLRKPVVDQPGLYVLNVRNRNNGCEATDTVRVEKNLAIPTGLLGMDRTLDCNQDTIDITADLRNYKPSYNFEFKGPGISGIQERNPRQIIRIPGIYYTRITTPNPECISTDTLLVRIDTMHHKVGIPDTVWFSCEDRFYQFTVPDFARFDSVSWKDVFDRRLPTPDSGRTGTFLFEGEYSYITYPKNGCSVSGKIRVLPYSTLILDKLEIKPSCASTPSGSIKIFARSPIGPVRYSINGSAKDTTSFYGNLPPDVYIIRIYDALDCQKDTVVTIRSLLGLPLGLNGFRDSFEICKDTVIHAAELLRAFQFPPDSASFIWRLGNSQIGKDTSQYFDKPGNYTLSIMNRNGCDQIDIFYTITQDPSLARQKIQLPNVFTPNGDMENDDYKPVIEPGTIFEPEGYKLRIFNRWGQIVFESDDPTETWNGNFRGEPAPVETYIVQFKAVLDLCGSMRQLDLKTTLNLIR